MIQEFLGNRSVEERFIPVEGLRKTRDVLAVLTDRTHPNYHLYACLNYYYSGERFAERGRFDIAVFLLYRTIEMILSGTLKEIGIDPSEPEYPSWVTLDEYNKKLREVFETDYYEKVLPHKVGLMDSAILLAMKKDPLLEGLNLKELKGIITVRNDSHFTHGSRALGEEDFRKIRRIGRKLLERCLSLKNQPMAKYFEALFSFPRV